MQMDSLILFRLSHPSLVPAVAYHHLCDRLLYFSSICLGIDEVTVEQLNYLLLPKRIVFYVILYS